MTTISNHATALTGQPGPMTPTLCRIVSRRQELPDTVTLGIDAIDDEMAAMRPGQFNMLWAIGVGEVAISVSGGLGSADGPLQHTIRSVGAVTAALCALEPGATLGVRGPFGTHWGMDDATLDGQHALFIAGGLGLAPLRGAIDIAAGPHSRFASCSVLIGTRTPESVLYREDIDRWREGHGRTAIVTVDRGSAHWNGPVGVVTDLLPQLELDPGHTVAFVCGPEIMMVKTADALVALGVPATKIRLSLERNMKCAVAMCGHCQLGAEFVCHDGPVFTYDRIAPLLRVAEL